MYNDINDKYILAEYIVADPETGRPIHKRINLQYIRNPISRAVISAKVFGSWRNRGFWTEKDYIAEEGLEPLFSKIQAKFMDADVISKDEKFAEVKNQIAKELKDIVEKIEGTKMTDVGVYGANHNDISLGSSPMTPSTPGAIDVRSIW
jgi:hypothetical protein